MLKIISNNICISKRARAFIYISMKIGLRLLCDSHILYNTGDNIFLSFRILLTLALIPCVAVNLCPGELILVTVLRDCSTSCDLFVPPKGLGKIRSIPFLIDVIQLCDS